MGLWNTHGMVDDLESCLDAASDLGLMPDELVALADRCDDERDLFLYLREHKRGQEKRKCTLMAQFWRNRARRFKEMAAASEQELTLYQP